MKIGIVTSWNDNLALFKFLSKYDHEYFVYYDFCNRTYWDKDFDYVKKEIAKWIEFLKSQWVEKIILPPTFELEFDEEIIFPLFQEYILEYWFRYSLVGKIGLFWDFVDIQRAQELLQKIEKKYTLTDHQKNIKKFSSPFSYWTKEVNLRKYYLTNLSYSDFMVNKVIKFDLRYFKDAGVDTVLPLNYWYFNYEKTISKYFNFHKTRFHKVEKVEECFVKLVEKKSEEYSVKVFFTWHIEFLKREKRLLRLLQRWKSSEIVFDTV